MTDRSLIHFGGLSAVVGGSLMLVDVALHLFVDDRFQPTEFAGLPHEVWHAPGIIALPLVLVGLIAIYLRQSGESGGVGLWGFVLLVVGMTAGAIYTTIFHGLFLPAIEGIESGLFELLADSPTTAQVVRGIVVQALGLGLGAVLFGIATVRAGVFPPVAGWLLISAAVFAAANQVFPEGQLISRVLFAAYFGWLGLRLGQPHPEHAASLS